MRAVSIDNKKISQSSLSMIDGWAKKLIFKWLAKMKNGRLTVIDNGEKYSFGESESDAKIYGIINVEHQSTYRDMLFNGAIGTGEAYMKGSWSSPNLVHVIQVICQNMDLVIDLNSGWSKFSNIFMGWAHRLYRSNNKHNSKLNIAAHYDLGNDFFSLFLDPNMMYSSAIYPDEKINFNDAASYKLDHICQQLKLTASDHLLEIGTGWGGMAIYAAINYGCKVTTTTISQEQHKYAVEQVKAEGLEHKITVLLDDYRDLTGQFDKLVSIEMIEAVGPQYYKSYFHMCSNLLKKDGLMLIQAITMPDQRYAVTSDGVDFIQKYIFPGGHLPCNSVLLENVAKYTDMQVVGIEDITFDYAKTLHDWRERFFDQLSAVKKQGYDDVFIRMWDYYLSYCEGGFRERAIGTIQMLIAKPRCLHLPAIKNFKTVA
jgi:cyclopropane-fatty-acyl-phospholipid synthase